MAFRSSLLILLFSMLGVDIVTSFSTRLAGISQSRNLAISQTRTTTTTELGVFSFFQKPQQATPPPPIIPGVGPEGCQLPSPSRINTVPKPLQAKAVVGIFAALFLGTQAFSSVLTDWTAHYEWAQTFRYSWPVVLGAVFVAAGVTHFTVEDEYCNIYPSRGTWGLWYLPGSPQFHVQWTGVAEIFGGVGLLLGGAIDSPLFPVYFDSPNLLSSNAGLLSDSAAALCLLTLAVTPANIYMYTHGARLPKEGPAVPISFHVIRGAFQVVLLGLLYQMGEGTFDAWQTSLWSMNTQIM
jgi:uncharacterized membrane protein